MDTRQKISFAFYVKRTKPHKTGEVPIYVKITVDKRYDELAVLRSIHPDLWNPETNSAIEKTKNERDLNTYLIRVKTKLEDHVAELYQKGRDVTPRSIKDAYLGIDNEKRHVIMLFSEHNQQAELLKGKEFAPATIQRYETCKKHLKDYIRNKYRENDLPLSKVDPDFVKGFELYMKTVKKCAHNTTVKYIRNFKKIISSAFRNGWIPADPFNNVKLQLKPVVKDFLTEEELQAIIDKKFDTERLEQVKDVFLFGCFTGLAFSDLEKLNPDNIVTGTDGRLWIHTKRQKTKNVCHIPLLPVAQSILDKYKYNPYLNMKNVLLPVDTNQSMNAYLKEIGEICKIKKYITSHMARHTFATTITLNNGIPIESVSKMLGHSSIKMTQVYAKLLDKKVGSDMEKIRDKFTPGNNVSPAKETKPHIPVCPGLSIDLKNSMN